MGETVLAELIDAGEQLCVFFFPPFYHEVLDSMDISRFTFKVVSSVHRDGTKLNSTQVFLVAIHFLWLYDYFLTFGDEVRYPTLMLSPRFLSLFR